MSITETVTFDKEGRVERFPWFRKLFLSIIIILVTVLSFGIGRLSVIGNREPIRIEYDPVLTSNSSTSEVDKLQTASVIQAVEKTEVIASKNGSRYHYPHCGGAKQIKEENRITFSTPAAAEAAGYTLAANCKPK